MNNRIKELRIKNKISQKELAKKLNTTQQAISLYEKGEREPKIELWQKIADFFGVTIQYLQGLTYDEFLILKIVNDEYLKDTLNKVSTDFKSTVDDYLKSKGYSLPLKKFSEDELKEFTPQVYKYWKDRFSFIFNYYWIIALIDYGGNDNDVVSAFKEAIREKYLADNETAISKTYDQIAKTIIDQFYYHADDMVRFDKKEEIDVHVDNVISALSNFKNALKGLPNNEHMRPINEDDLPFQ